MTDSKDGQIDQENRLGIGFNLVHFAIRLFSTKVSSQCCAEREDISTNDTETIQYQQKKSKRISTSQSMVAYTTELGKLRQEVHDFKVSLSYKTRLRKKK